MSNMQSYAPPRPTKYCEACHRVIDAMAVVCTGCGVMQTAPQIGSDRRILPAALLAVFFGVFGAHRFYAGKTKTAIIQLFTLGGLGIWALIDLILIITGSFTDGEGEKITEWT